MAIAGIRGTGSFAADQRPKSWREGVLLSEPNGEVPFYALTSKMKEKQLTDPEHSWWTKTLAQDTVAVTGVYESSALSNAYDASDDYAAGSLVYVKMTAALIADFIPGQTVRFCSVDTNGKFDPGAFTPINGKVMARQNAGDNSYLTIKLSEADGAGNGDLSASRLRLTILGTAFAEASGFPQAISYNPTKITNYTQIAMNTLKGSRTMKHTKTRTGDTYNEMKRETLQYHMLGIEKTLLFGGPPSEAFDSESGQVVRETGGVYYFLKTYAPNNVNDYTQNTTYTGQEWIVGGEDWLNAQVENLFRYGTSTEKPCFCGPGALTAINKIAASKGIVELPSVDAGYGMKFKRWETAHGDLLLKKHPLFNKHPEWYNAIFAIEPKNLTYIYMDDTMFVNDENRSKLTGGAAFIDGFIEGWVTEFGLEMAFAEQFGFFSGVGQDNALT